MAFHCEILTLFPGMIEGYASQSILGKARDRGHVTLVTTDIRRFAIDKHNTTDDSPYGGGAGMILKPEPIFECVDMLIAERPYDEVILTTPKGTLWTQSEANRMSMRDAVIIICGHYKGVDERVRQALVTREISIGDVVLTGGELVAMVIVDTVVRLIPGVIGDGESLLSDSFMDGRLDCPYYTRPPEYRGLTVPEALQSGDHKAIAAWRDTEAMRVTRERRPDLLRNDDRPPGTNEK